MHLNYFRNPKITARRGTLSSFSGMAAVNNLLGVVRVTGFWPRAAGRRCRGPCGSTHCFTEEALCLSDGPGGGFQEFIQAPGGISSASSIVFHHSLQHLTWGRCSGPEGLHLLQRGHTKSKALILKGMGNLFKSMFFRVKD